VNLIYLSHFFPETELQGILADTVLKVKPNISVPGLAAADREFQAQLAIAENSRFELESLINATMNKEAVFSSVGHLALRKFFDADKVNQSINLFNFRDWLLLSLGVAVAGHHDSLYDISEDSH
jgi:hypothetical protein